MQVKTWDNIRPLNGDDQALGLALCQFGKMIEDGVALVAVKPEFKLPPLTHPKNEYPSHHPHLAHLSIKRARAQFAKGNITQTDLDEIVARCNAVISQSIQR